MGSLRVRGQGQSCRLSTLTGRHHGASWNWVPMRQASSGPTRPFLFKAQPHHPIQMCQCCWACGTGPSASCQVQVPQDLCQAHHLCWALGAPQKPPGVVIPCGGEERWWLWVGRKGHPPNTVRPHTCSCRRRGTKGLLPVYKSPGILWASREPGRSWVSPRSLSVFPYPSHSKVNPKLSSPWAGSENRSISLRLWRSSDL